MGVFFYSGVSVKPTILRERDENKFLKIKHNILNGCTFKQQGRTIPPHVNSYSNPQKNKPDAKKNL